MIPRDVESSWILADPDMCLRDRTGIVLEFGLMISSVFVVEEEDERAGETGRT